MCALLILMCVFIDKYTLCLLFCIVEKDKGAHHPIILQIILIFPNFCMFGGKKNPVCDYFFIFFAGLCSLSPTPV